MSNRSQSLLMATEAPESIPVRQDRRRLLALGTAWLVLGTLSGAVALTANSATLAVLGALGMIVAALTVHGAVGSHHDATVFALVLPGSLQPVAVVLMVVYSVTATAGSALMLAGFFLGEGTIRVGSPGTSTSQLGEGCLSTASSPWSSGPLFSDSGPSQACGSWDCPSESTWLAPAGRASPWPALSKHPAISPLEKEEPWTQ
jgi:uncharacterized membrane protein HdeD (DUF308 family)